MKSHPLPRRPPCPPRASQTRSPPCPPSPRRPPSPPTPRRTRRRPPVAATGADRALGQIEKAYGSGSIMRLDNDSIRAALRLHRHPQPRPRARRPRAAQGRVEVFGPESSGKTTLALTVAANAQKDGGVAAIIDAEHALDPTWAKRLGVDLDELLLSQPDTGEQALEICELLVRSNAVDVVVVDSVAALIPRPRSRARWATATGAAGQADEPGPPQAHRRDRQEQLHRDLHQPAPREDRGDVREPRDHHRWTGAQGSTPRSAWTSGGSARSRTARRTSATGSRRRSSRTRSPRRSGSAEFDIMFNEGISVSGDLVDLAVEDNIIKKARPGSATATSAWPGPGERQAVPPGEPDLLRRDPWQGGAQPDAAPAPLRGSRGAGIGLLSRSSGPGGCDRLPPATIFLLSPADVAELADALGSGPSGSKIHVEVRALSSA